MSQSDESQVFFNYVQKGRGHMGGLIQASRDNLTLIRLLARAVSRLHVILDLHERGLLLQGEAGTIFADSCRKLVDEVNEISGKEEP